MQIEILLAVIAILLAPVYSSYVIEWRIKRYVKKFKLEDLIETIRTVADAFKEEPSIEIEPLESLIPPTVIVTEE